MNKLKMNYFFRYNKSNDTNYVSLLRKSKWNYFEKNDYLDKVTSVHKRALEEITVSEERCS